MRFQLPNFEPHIWLGPLQVWVHGYAQATPTDYSANWLIVSALLETTFSVSYLKEEHCLLTEEVDNFLSQLKYMHDGQQMHQWTAKLRSMHPNLRIKIKRIGDDEASYEFWAQCMADQRFEKHRVVTPIIKADVDRLICQYEALMGRYQVRLRRTHS